MNEHERAFLAELAIGKFFVDQDGKIWRTRGPVGGSKVGTPAPERMLAVPQRVDTGRSHGYLRVQFTINGTRMRAYAHRLVWMIANQSDIPAGMDINHKNGNKTDNSPDNLEVVTRQENMLHAGRILKVMGKKEQRGEKNTSAKLTAEQVLIIRSMWDNREVSQSEMARRYGVSQVTINEICLRKTWKHLP